jgi:NADH:ubiquinone oxidoreductase subunit 3 (subunit A)
MSRSVSHSVDYIATALMCVVLLLLLVWAMCLNQPALKPTTSQKTKDRLATLEHQVRELRGEVSYESAEAGP